ncbi:hypothetical protein [Hymenobacter aerophilus]|uniref:hypothetical protein n=1 Tax=Hymenobacter aerophilus TaxID=119644 RepID=UPI0012FB1012|nr:hypothetical protein [Hymenobacter aerophilus]
MTQLPDEEPEDAGLIQSKPPTEKELQEISHFIAQSKQRNAGLRNPWPLSPKHQQSPEEEP